MSQRELAEACGVAQSVVARAEAGRRDLPVRVLARAAAVAALRLVLVDDQGNEVQSMADGTVRDMGGRRMPAHLDTVHSDERPGRYQERHYRPQPWYTFDLDRAYRDESRRLFGTPLDHLFPQPGTAPWEQRQRLRCEASRRSAEERERRLRAGEPRDAVPDFVCACPPGCEGIDDGEGRPRHTDDCPCGCDVG